MDNSPRSVGQRTDGTRRDVNPALWQCVESQHPFDVYGCMNAAGVASALGMALRVWCLNHSISLILGIPEPAVLGPPWAPSRALPHSFLKRA